MRLPFAATDARRLGLPADLARQGREDDHPREPEQPASTLVPVAALRALATRRATQSSSSTRPTSTSRWPSGIDASLLPYLDAHPNVVVLRTFSKSYSLAGARLGLMFAAAPLVER